MTNTPDVKKIRINYTVCDDDDVKYIFIKDNKTIDYLTSKIESENKKIIRNYCREKSFNIKRCTQKIMYNGIILNNCKTISECNIQDCSQLNLRIGYEVTINVKMDNNTYYINNIKIHNIKNIGELKTIIANRLVLDASNIQISCGGHILEDRQLIAKLKKLRNIDALVSIPDNEKIKNLIFLVGPSQAGKSTLANFLYHNKLYTPDEVIFPTGLGSNSVTTHIKIEKIDELRNIYVVDTPGLSSTNGITDDVEIHRQIYSFLYYIKNRKDIKISAFLLVCKLGYRLDGDFKRTVNLYKHIFYRYFYNNLSLIISGVSKAPWRIREIEYTTKKNIDVVIAEFTGIIKKFLDIDEKEYLRHETIDSIPIHNDDLSHALNVRKSIIERSYLCDFVDTKYINYIKPSLVRDEINAYVRDNYRSLRSFTRGKELFYSDNPDIEEHGKLIELYYNEYIDYKIKISDCNFIIKNLDTNTLVQTSEIVLTADTPEYIFESNVPIYVKHIQEDIEIINTYDDNNYYYRISKKDDITVTTICLYKKSSDNFRKQISNSHKSIVEAEEQYEIKKMKILEKLKNIENRYNLGKIISKTLIKQDVDINQIISETLGSSEQDVESQYIIRTIVHEILMSSEQDVVEFYKFYKTVSKNLISSRRVVEDMINGVSILGKRCYTGDEILQFI